MSTGVQVESLVALGGHVESLVSQFNFLSMRARDIAVSLLTRAIPEGRESEMLEKIGQRVERAHYMPEGHEEGLRLALLFDHYCGPSQTLRKTSLRTGVIMEDTARNSGPKPILN